MRAHGDAGVAATELAIFLTALLVLILFGDAAGWWTLNG